MNNQNVIINVKIDTDYYRPSKRGGVARKAASSPETWNWPDKYFTTGYEIRDLKNEYENINNGLINKLKYIHRLKEITIKINQNEKYRISIDRSFERFKNKTIN